MMGHFRIFIDFTLMAEVFLALFLLSRLFPLRKLSHRRGLMAGYFAGYWAFLAAQDYWAVLTGKNAYPVFLATHVLMMFFYALIFCEGKLVFKVYLPFVYVSMVTLSGFPVSLLQPFLMGSFFYVFKAAGLLVLSAATLFLLHFRPDTQTSYPSSYYVVMIVMPLLNMVTISSLKEYSNVFPYVNLVGCFTLILELLIYYTVWQITREYTKNIELRLIAQQQQFQAVHMEELRDIVTDYHQIRHDMKTMWSVWTGCSAKKSMGS